MRKLLVILLFIPIASFAQQSQFGFFSLSEVMEALPECKVAQDDYNSLLERCDSEIARSEEELTRNYVSFLDGQNSFPEPILRKRQKELQDLVDRSVVLRDQLKDWLAQAHDSLFNPIVGKIDKAVENVCLRSNLAYAIDTDKAVYRFVNPNIGINITDLVIQEVISPRPAPQTAPVTEDETVTATNGNVAVEEEGLKEVTE